MRAEPCARACGGACRTQRLLPVRHPCHAALFSRSIVRGGTPGSCLRAVARSGVVLAAYRAAVGIDLGTSTSAVAVVGPEGRPQVVEDDAGRAVIPSVLFVRQDGSVLVGDEAVRAAESDPSNVLYGIKRLMGRSYREALDETAYEDGPSSSTSSTSSIDLAPSLSHALVPGGQAGSRRRRSYSLVQGPGGRVEVAVPALGPGRSLAPQEASAHLLGHLVARARAFLERQRRQAAEGADEEVEVLDAVVTVPAHFSPVQRRAVVEAARAAGLQRVTLLQEPIAAAMAYGFGSSNVPYDVLLVWDLGGGTLDLTVVEAFDGIMEVLSTSGDNYLGGDDFTAAVADWLAAAAASAAGEGAGAGPRAESKTGGEAAAAAARSLALLRAAEAAKLALSEAVMQGKSQREDGAGNGGSSSSNSSNNGSCGSGAGVSVRVRLPRELREAGGGGGRGAGSGGGGSGAGGGEGDAGVELREEEFEQMIRPLLRRMWWPLERLALETRMQLGGSLPPHLDPRVAPGQASTPAASGGTSLDAEGPGRRDGAAAWEFSIFPSANTGASGGNGAKYVAPPRRLTGLVLVGAATRLPVVRDYITQVTGLQVRPGVDPETAVAVGAALHAGLMVGAVGGGVELNDGGYVAAQHGRASGFQEAVGVAAGAYGNSDDEDGAALVWEP